MTQLPEHVTVDAAHGVMQTHTLTRVQVRDLAPVPDYSVHWERVLPVE